VVGFPVGIALAASAYNGTMRGWSFPVGRFFGVEVRIHAFFLLLLALAIGVGSLAGASTGRVLTLWLLLLFAVVVREVARALAAAWFGLDLRGILLLPTGGLFTYATVDATERAAEPAMQRRMAVIGPLASIGAGLLLGAIILASAPGIEADLVGRPLIEPSHLLRAMVWLNILLGAINLLPALPLDGGRVFQLGTPGKQANGKVERRIANAGAASSGFRLWGLGGGLGQWIAVALVVAGLLMPNLWLVIMGAFVLIGAHMENQGLLVQSDVDTVRMRDVMLTQFSTLSASDTLEDALQRAVHSMQDVFPVVRGGTLVGAVSRQNIVEALASEGNSYVQGVMTKSFQTALPDDSLVKTLRRILGEQGAQLVPVMEGERIVGIVTPQNLSQSMGLLNQSRRVKRTEEA
jgi:CBS domain-containing protein/Zn-dependent protease